MVWQGLDLYELGMLIFLLAHLLHGLYRVDQNITRDFGITIMWAAYSFWAGLFLIGFLGSAMIDETLLDKVIDFFSRWS